MEVVVECSANVCTGPATSEPPLSNALDRPLTDAERACWLIARVLMADMPEGARLFGYKPLLDRILHPEVLRWLPEGQGGMPLWLEAKAAG